MSRLQGKAAVITGSSKGIGKAIALLFAEEGANIVVTGRSEQSTEPVVDEIKRLGVSVTSVAADLAVDGSVDRIIGSALREFGTIDILVNSAAIVHPNVDLVEFDISYWREVIEVNLVSVAALMKAALPTMIANRSGRIINISSIGGRKGGKRRSAYRASKAAVISLTESVAAEVKQYGIDVNCICPGAVDTEGYRKNFGVRGVDDDPLLANPIEIARIALFLATEESSAITGTAIDAFGRKNPLFG